MCNADPCCNGGLSTSKNREARGRGLLLMGTEREGKGWGKGGRECQLCRVAGRECQLCRVAGNTV